MCEGWGERKEGQKETDLSKPVLGKSLEGHTEHIVAVDASDVEVLCKRLLVQQSHCLHLQRRHGDDLAHHIPANALTGF